jgi:hypothetical protein
MRIVKIIQAALLLGDVSHYAVRRKPRQRLALVLFDEFSSLEGGRRTAINLVERARGPHVGDRASLAQLLVERPTSGRQWCGDAHLVSDVGDRPSRLGGDPTGQGQPSRRRQPGVSVGHEASSERVPSDSRTSLGGLTSRQQPLWAEQLVVGGSLTRWNTTRCNWFR